jgi:hypothetical protein
MSEITLEDVKRLHLEPGDHLAVRVQDDTHEDVIDAAQELDRPIAEVADDVDAIVISGIDPARARPMLPRYLA